MPRAWGLPLRRQARLPQQEVAERIAKGEVNKAPGGTNRSYLEIIRQNVFTFINIMLFAIGVALIILGRLDDALITVGVVLINVVVGGGAGGASQAEARQDCPAHTAKGDSAPKWLEWRSWPKWHYEGKITGNGFEITHIEYRRSIFPRPPRIVGSIVGGQERSIVHVTVEPSEDTSAIFLSLMVVSGLFSICAILSTMNNGTLNIWVLVPVAVFLAAYLLPQLALSREANMAKEFLAKVLMVKLEKNAP